jgi:hypothetical protein
MQFEYKRVLLVLHITIEKYSIVFNNLFTHSSLQIQTLCETQTPDPTSPFYEATQQFFSVENIEQLKKR